MNTNSPLSSLCKIAQAALRAFTDRLCQRSRQLSADHEQAWDQYDKVLMSRNSLFFFMQVLEMVFSMLLLSSTMDQSRKFIEEGEDHDNERVAVVFPILQAVLICMAFGRIPLALATLCVRRKNWSRCLLYYHLLYVICEMTLPVDHGDFIGRTTVHRLLMAFIGLSFDLKSSLLPILLTQLYVEDFTTVYIYDRTFGRAEALAMTINMFNLAVMCTFAQFVISWVGELFVEIQLLHKSKDATLQNIKEGVLMVKPDTCQVLFANRAANHGAFFNAAGDNLTKGSRPDESFLLESAHFAMVDIELFEDNGATSGSAIKKLRNSTEYVSLRQIIQDESKDEHVFKVDLKKTQVEPVDQQGGGGTLQTESCTLEELPNQFIAIRVKRQTYLGQPVIAVFVSDETKKVRSKILQLMAQEAQAQLQASRTEISAMMQDLEGQVHDEEKFSFIVDAAPEAPLLLHNDQNKEKQTELQRKVISFKKRKQKSDSKKPQNLDKIDPQSNYRTTCPAEPSCVDLENPGSQVATLADPYTNPSRPTEPQPQTTFADICYTEEVEQACVVANSPALNMSSAVTPLHSTLVDKKRPSYDLTVAQADSTAVSSALQNPEDEELMSAEDEAPSVCDVSLNKDCEEAANEDQGQTQVHPEVLIVDDQLMSIEILSLMLANNGVTHDSATSGPIAIEYVQKRLDLVIKGEAPMYKIIILDFNMPIFDGPTVAASVTNLVKEMYYLGDDSLPLFCGTSGYSGNKIERKALEAGMSEFLVKPVVEAELVRIVRQELN